MINITFQRMLLEEWFDKYQYEVDYDIGESGVKFFCLEDLNLNLDKVELRYTYHIGNPELREEISHQYDRLNWNNIAVTTGAAESIFSLIASQTTRKDHIIIECPNYPSFWYIPQSLERHMDLLFLQYKEQFQPNIDRLETMIKPNTKLICLTVPNNPTGSIITLKELEQIIDLIESHDIYLLMDETYRDLTFGKPLPTAASLSDKAISVSTMSKVYGVPAIRIGWVASQDPNVINGVLKVREQTTICNSTINEAIALQLLQKKEIHLVDITERVNRNFQIIREWFKNQQYLDLILPDGGVVCFPRYQENSEKICKLLVEKYRTFTVPGYCFMMNNFFRLGFGGETNELKAGLEKLGLAIEELQQVN